MVSPKRSSRTKYSANVRGGYNSNSFKDYRLPTSMVNALVHASNQSLALSTWSSYRTAENHLRQCEIDTGIKIRFPMTNRYNVLSFLPDVSIFLHPVDFLIVIQFSWMRLNKSRA